jgi:hypothetical protein
LTALFAKVVSFREMAKKRYKSTMCRIREILAITQKHYEMGNYSKSYHAVWRRYIEPKYGICYHTYLSYLNEVLPKNYEPTLFDNEKDFDLPEPHPKR